MSVGNVKVNSEINLKVSVQIPYLNAFQKCEYWCETLISIEVLFHHGAFALSNLCMVLADSRWLKILWKTLTQIIYSWNHFALALSKISIFFLSLLLFFLLSRFVYHAEFLYLSVCFHYILSSLILDTALSAITRESLWTTMKAICTAWSIWKWAAMLFSFASYTAGLVQTTMAITSKPFWDKPDDIISNSRCLRDSNRKDSHVYRSFLWKPFA